MKMKRAYVWFVGLCLCVGAMTGCGASDEDNSTDSTEVTQPTQPGYTKTLVPDVTILDIREGYSDIATFCEGPNRVYINDSNGTAFAVGNDPRCTGGAQ